MDLCRYDISESFFLIQRSFRKKADRSNLQESKITTTNSPRVNDAKVDTTGFRIRISEPSAPQKTKKREAEQQRTNSYRGKNVATLRGQNVVDPRCFFLRFGSMDVYSDTILKIYNDEIYGDSIGHQNWWLIDEGHLTLQRDT